MTDAFIPTAIRIPRAARRRAVLWGTVAVAAFAGVLLGARHAADPAGIEGALALLLRFMALCKAAMALAGTLLVAWRLGHPLRPATFATYLAALIPMAAAPGVIWGLGLVAPGALLFHAGFIAFLVLAARDAAVGAGLSRIGRRAR